MNKQFNSRLAWALLLLGIAVACAWSEWLIPASSVPSSDMPWVPYTLAGISLTCAVIWGRRVWPAIFVGVLAAGLVSPAPALVVLVGASLAALQTALVGWWFHDRIGRRLELDQVRDVIALLASEMLVVLPVETAIGHFTMRATTSFSADQLTEAAVAFYTTNLMVLLIAAPTALVWLRWPRPATRDRWPELGLVAALTLAIGAGALGRWSFHGMPLPFARFAVFPLIVWASWRFVPSVAVTVAVVVGIFAFDAALSGRGAFAGSVPLDARMLSLNIFVAVLLVTALFLASVMASERRREAEQKELIAQLRASNAQVARLEEIVTMCAWTGQVRWKGEWVQMEEFLSDRFNMKVSHGISEEGKKLFLSGDHPGASSPLKGGPIVE